MITGSILEAVGRMIDGCDTPEQKGAMDALKEMLCDFNEDQWDEMSDEDKQNWIHTFLSKMSKDPKVYENNSNYEFEIAEMTIGKMLHELDKLNIDEVQIFNTNRKHITDTPFWSGSMDYFKSSPLWDSETYIQSVSIDDDWAILKFDFYQVREKNLKASLNDRIKNAEGKARIGSDAEGLERKNSEPAR